jgi:hypothetical protein
MDFTFLLPSPITRESKAMQVMQAQGRSTVQVMYLGAMILRAIKAEPSWPRDCTLKRCFSWVDTFEQKLVVNFRKGPPSSNTAQSLGGAHLEVNT